MKRWFAVLIVSLAACTALNCTPKASSGTAVPEVMSFLSAARALHREADLLEEENRPADAIRALERVIALPHQTMSPEVHEVLADTHARLAETQLKQKDFIKALDNVHQGLSHAEQPTYFRGHLLEVEGAVLEAESKKLAAEGRESDAALKRKEALARLNDAVAIHERVIRQQLSDGGSTR